MLRLLVIFTAVTVLSGLATASDTTSISASVSATPQAFNVGSHDIAARSPVFLNSLGIRTPEAAVAQQGCCKICTRGKACGNTCISQDKVCHVGAGCACDG